MYTISLCLQRVNFLCQPKKESNEAYPELLLVVCASWWIPFRKNTTEDQKWNVCEYSFSFCSNSQYLYHIGRKVMLMLLLARNRANVICVCDPLDWKNVEKVFFVHTQQQAVILQLTFSSLMMSTSTKSIIGHDMLWMMMMMILGTWLVSFYFNQKREEKTLSTVVVCNTGLHFWYSVACYVVGCDGWRCWLCVLF